MATFTSRHFSLNAQTKSNQKVNMTKRKHIRLEKSYLNLRMTIGSIGLILVDAALIVGRDV